MSAITPQKFPVSNTIFETVLTTCRRIPDKTAIVGKGGRGAIYSYRDVEHLIRGISGSLRSKGLTKGDRVAIISENCPEWGLSFLGILTAGCVAVPFDASLKETELARFLRVSGIKLIFASPAWYKPVTDLVTLNGLSLEIVALNCDDNNFRRMVESESYVAAGIAGDDMAMLIYTSGTTGDPKGVILSHRNILGNIFSLVQIELLREEEVLLSVLPLHHTLESTCGLLFPLCGGMTVVYARSRKSRDLIEDIKNNGVTCMIAVPLLYEKMYNAVNKRISELPFPQKTALKSFYAISKLAWKLGPNIGRTLFKGLRTKVGLEKVDIMVSGGAPLPRAVSEWFNLLGFAFLNGYGMTECSPVISVARPGEVRFESAGPPLPDVEIEIDNPSPDGIGEIKVRGPNCTCGYLDNPAATSELIREGWLHTGDLGKMDKGHIYITGRKKNLIVSGGGKNIYPEEIEAELNLSPYILESIVFGRSRIKKAGEEIWAIIVPDLEQARPAGEIPDEISSPKRIREIVEREIAAVNDRLADFKRIAQFEIRMEEFEKTSTRKIKRGLYI